MTLTSLRPLARLHQRAAMAVAMAVVCASASALPAFTLDPAAAGLAGTSFTADNFLTADYSTVRFDNLGHFTNTGFLSVSAVELSGTTFAANGLNATPGYSMYFAFTGEGNAATGVPGAEMMVGQFTALTYTLYGYDGLASFGFDASNNPTTTAAAANRIVLATGSLMPGAVGDGTASLSFVTAPERASFFVMPNTFYSAALAAFTNTLTNVQAFDGAFRMFIGGGAGGGSVNFGEPRAVPEPSINALMLAGLAAAGLAARRRRLQ